MAERLSNFALDESIFVDANVFDYHHSNHPRFGSDCTDFLKKIETGTVHAVTSNVVQQEAMYFLQMLKGELLLGTPDRSRIHAKIAADAMVAQECWKAAEKFLNLLDALRSATLMFFEVDSSHARQIVELGKRYQLILRDAAHVCVCQVMNLSHIASNDADFDRVDFLTRWKPGS
jgi:hypothetical protein